MNNNKIKDLSFWKDGKLWACAIPRDDFATRLGYDWKNYGLIGRGKTKEAAIKDWEKWVTASKVVSDIY